MDREHLRTNPYQDRANILRGIENSLAGTQNTLKSG